MSAIRQKFRIGLTAVALAFTVAWPGSASSATLYWAGGGNNPVTGGSGTWDLSTANWNTTAYGGDGSGTTLNYTAATLDGTTTSGNATVTMSNTSGILKGAIVSGSGVPPGTYVTSVTTDTSVVLSAVATNSVTESFSFGRMNDQIILGGTPGTITLGAPITFANGNGTIRFSSSYTLAGNATNKLLIPYSSASDGFGGSIKVDSGVSAVVSYMSSSAQTDITGNGTLTLSNSTITGGLKVGGTYSVSPYTNTVVIGAGNNFSTAYLRVNDTSKLQLNGNNLAVANFSSDSSSMNNALIENGGSTDATLGAVNYTGGGTYYGILRDGSGGGKLSLVIDKKNAGQFITLAGTQANAFTGTTTISNGDLTLAKSAGVEAISGKVIIGDAAGTDVADRLVLGANNQINDASIIEINNGQAANRVAAFVLNGFNETVGGVSSIATGANSFIRNEGAANSTLTVNDASNREFKGAIINGTGGGTMSIVKAGAGTWTLSGTNTYSGATTVEAGKLVVNGAIGSSAVTVTNTGALGGSGSVGALTIADGGTLAPGNSPGTLFASSATWANGGSYDWEILNLAGPAGDPTGWDLLDVDGELSLTGLTSSNFTINLITLSDSTTRGALAGFDPSATYTNWMIARAGTITGFNASLFNLSTAAFSNTITGTFGITNGTYGGDQALFLTYTGGGAPIPEPGTWAAAALLVATAVFMRWRRRRVQAGA